ncbi:MAG: hypothetical protein IPI67_26935 [Myxococcales bacterium]|nr:hypothetical protein [Myxococcales bacterium]
MRSLAKSLLGTLLLFTALAAGCSSDGDSDARSGGGSAGSGGTAGTGGGAAGTGGPAGAAGDAASGGSAGAASLSAALEAQGFEVRAGKFDLLDLSDCCDVGKTCSGNNPTSPYGAFFVPRAPGQTVANPNEEPGGLASSFRLRADEALVYVGTTPPKAKYFGFTPYLIDREGALGVRKPVFASLSETLNNLVIQVGGKAEPFDAEVAIIATADQTTETQVKVALTTAGIPATVVNTLTFDSKLVKLGIADADDTVGVLSRVAIFDDAAKGKAYLDAIPGVLLRVTPKSPTTPNPLPSPPSRAKNMTDTETSLTSALDALEAAVIAQNPGWTGKSMIVTKGTPDPLACIQGQTFCAGDNRDTNYPSTIPQPLFASPDDFFIVIGVDHTLTGKTSYANFSVYAIEHLVGVASVSNVQYAGSATALLPGDPGAAKLYAWKVARTCGSDPHCLAIPDAACPTGVGAGKSGTITFRTYLEPKTQTAPDISTLALDRVIKFTKP